MKHKYLQDALPFLKEVDKERQRQFEFYFRNAPLWVMDLLQSEELEPGTTFIRENEPADTIFFIGRGRAKATDYRISGIAYDFMKPKDLIALGGMEVIMELENYQTTWETETKCTVVKLPEQSMRNGFMQTQIFSVWSQRLHVNPCWKKAEETDCIFSFRERTDWHFFLLNGLRNSTEMENSVSMKADRALQMRQGFALKVSAGE